MDILIFHLVVLYIIYYKKVCTNGLFYVKIVIIRQGGVIMIITIDGGDGCGKSTLAHMIAEHYNFTHIKKPIDDFLGVKKPDSVRASASKLVQKVVYDINKNEKVKVGFNNGLLLYYKNKLQDENAVIDRGPLSCYLFNGSPITESTFDYFLRRGLNFDLNIFLKASNKTRLTRLAQRNNADPDLNDEKVGALSDNQDRALAYATSRNLNVLVIETDDKSPEEVFEIARERIDSMIAQKQNPNNMDTSAEMFDDE